MCFIAEQPEREGVKGHFFVPLVTNVSSWMSHSRYNVQKYNESLLEASTVTACQKHAPLLFPALVAEL